MYACAALSGPVNVVLNVGIRGTYNIVFTSVSGRYLCTEMAPPCRVTRNDSGTTC